MRTVRVKLVALIVACVAPAIAGAVYRSYEAEKDLLAQVERRVDGANQRFGAELDEDQDSARLALALVEHSARFQQGLAKRDPAATERLTNTLGDVYKDHAILAIDPQGVIVSMAHADNIVYRGYTENHLPLLGIDTSPAFADLIQGKDVTGLTPIEYDEGEGYALMSGLPVHDASGAHVGAIALVTQITEKYLEHLEPKLNADLSFRVNGKLVAACKDHPAPGLEALGDVPVQKEVGGKLFAVKTFRPEKLQRPGMVVELTASRDVTDLRTETRKKLYRDLGGLGLALIIVLALALRFASRLGGSVRAISDAAAHVKGGKYVNAPIVPTGDEIEQLANDFNAMVQGLKERDQLRETFGRYVTRQVADHLMKGNQVLGGELVPVTVLFSDIRSFTSISETMDPRALLNFLNEYFTGMVESVMLNHGVVDKFIGDAIMAVFGAPVPTPEDPLHAVKAALAMRTRLAKINEDFKRRGLPEIRAGIGLHSGQVVAGNMGHAERMEYTVIGDAVNLASRLEGMTKELGCDVVLSEDLYKQVARQVHAEPLHKIKVKGRDQEVMVYRLVGLSADQPATPEVATA
jgi:adenylate cyclase